MTWQTRGDLNPRSWELCSIKLAFPWQRKKKKEEKKGKTIWGRDCFRLKGTKQYNSLVLLNTGTGNYVVVSSQKLLVVFKLLSCMVDSWAFNLLFYVLTFIYVTFILHYSYLESSLTFQGLHNLIYHLDSHS